MVFVDFLSGFFIDSQGDLLANFTNSEKLNCEICPAFEVFSRELYALYFKLLYVALYE